MINNEMENKGSLNTMSDLEFDKNSVEMMRYRANSLSYTLGFVAILCSLFAAFICLNSTQPITFAIILKIILNIIILLGGFLCCEKAKAYSKNASIGLMVFGGICIARIFWIPLQLIIYYSKYLTALSTQDKALENEALKYLGLPITGVNTGGANAWLPSSGYVRATIAIVLLCLAGLFFILSGIIGYARSKKLNTYLDSLKKN
ncbi:TPA: hypothetical protein IAA91_04245 [Candidatus Avacholeplasma faecigallinarum]|nr:hypothetical protein [Candidatus Avacholeplasma faecigallinarum]